MIRPEVTKVFNSLAPLHQVLMLELFELQLATKSVTGEGTNFLIHEMFKEIVESYLAEKLLHYPQKEIERLKRKCDQLGFTRVNINRPI